MPEPITYATVSEALKAAVQDRGADWVYPKEADPVIDEDGFDYYPEEDEWHDDGNCVYALPSGEPACLVGYALAHMGYDVTAISNGGATDAVEQVVKFQQTGPDKQDPSLLRGRTELNMVAEALLAAQTAQDTGRTWGEAVESFENRYRIYSKGEFNV